MNDRIGLTRLFAIALVLYFFLGSSIWIAKGTLISESLFFIGVTFVGIGVLGRAWCLSYLSGNKGETLITKGPYSLCRNPLYLFSLAGALGAGLCTKTFTVPLVILFTFSVYYPSVIKGEERKLRGKFGAEYESYYKRAARLIPSFRNFAEDDTTLITSKVFRRGITDLLFFIVLVGIFEFIEGLHRVGWLAALYKIY